MNLGDPELASPNEFEEGNYTLQKFDPLEVGLGIYKKQQVPILTTNGQTEYRVIPVPLVQTGVDRLGNMTAQVPTSIDPETFFSIAADYLRALGEKPDDYINKTPLMEGIYDISSPESDIHMLFSEDEGARGGRTARVEITIPSRRLEGSKSQPDPISPMLEAVLRMAQEPIPPHLLRLIVLTQDVDRQRIVKRLNEFAPPYI